jgi:phytoene/squalene synthetase
LFELALSVLGPRDALAQAAAASAGQAYGLARMLLEVPALWALGRTLLPARELAAAGVMLSEFQEGLPPQRLQPIFAALAARARVHLAEVRRLAREIRREQHVALLPTALVEPYLQALEKPGRDLLRDSSDIAPLSRTWRLLRAHWSKRL